MNRFFRKLFNGMIAEEVKKATAAKKRGASGYGSFLSPLSDDEIIAKALPRIFQRTQKDFAPVQPPDGRAVSMDAALEASGRSALPDIYRVQNTVPALVMQWFGAHSFIGHQACAILAQHWLINKACGVPPKDAIQNGYKLVLHGVEGDESTAILEEITAINKEKCLLRECKEFVRYSRIFGIRHALFLIDGINYEAPFNADGILPGSYRGISQIDPYWLTPEFDTQAIADPSSAHFYEPTWWRLPGGNRVHRSHFVILREDEVPDILKPTYFYGGNPLPQRIFERVYAAERTADEVPQLTMTKRLLVSHEDVEDFLMDEETSENRLFKTQYLRDNYGILAMGDADVQQFDTSLADLDANVMTQYQLVASIAGVPATKLLETSPKGFNATGEHESDSYDQTLCSIQTDGMTPLLDRHHLCLCRSKFPHYRDLAVTVEWEPVRAPKPGERADINLKNAQAGQLRIASGVISPEEEREKIKSEPDSGYPNLEDAEDADQGADDLAAFMEGLGEAGTPGSAIGEGWQG